MKTTRRLAISAALALSLTIHGTTTLSAPRMPRIETGPDAEVSFDGLHRVQRSVMDEAWAKPDLDLTGYNKLMIGSAGISYREVDDPGPFNRTATEFPISEESRERIRETVREIWTEEFENLENWEIVSEPDRDVLLLIGAMIDVVSAVPPESIGRGGVYLTRVGEATLVLELRDSMSNEVLARSADRRAADASFPIEANTVTTWAEVRRLARTWGRMLVNRLDQMAEL